VAPHRVSLSKGQARRFLLAHQNLWPARKLEGKAGILDHIRRVGCIQFDPLNIVGRNPDLVLQARIRAYDPTLLQDLLYEDRCLIDGLDKMMSIYPVEDWPYFRRRRERARLHYGDPEQPATAILPQVRQAIEERGPLSSIDLDYDQSVDWSWAPTRLARAALESMYFWGELVVHHKVNTRRVYDFAWRLIPDNLLSAPEPNEAEDAFHDWYVQRRIGGTGLLWGRAGDVWLAMGEIKSPQRRAALARLLDQGRVLEVQVEGFNQALYMRAEDQPRLDFVLAGDDPPPRATIMAPLDNLLWDRRFVEELFGFSYVWEVYKPAVTRRYGYYVLPILYGDRFVARFEPVRDKSNGGMQIKNWWWERDVERTPEMQAELRRCLDGFMQFLGAEELLVEADTLRSSGLQWLL
jgi:uncharacterized protein YcaQ